MQKIVAICQINHRQRRAFSKPEAELKPRGMTESRLLAEAVRMAAAAVVLHKGYGVGKC